MSCLSSFFLSLSLYLVSLHSHPRAQILLRETFAPRLLADKAKRLRKETGNTKLYTAFDRTDRTAAGHIGHGLLRALMFLATEPIVQVCAAYMAVLYGESSPLSVFVETRKARSTDSFLSRDNWSVRLARISTGLMYLTLATFASVWVEKYHRSVGVGGLNYLALGIGFTLGTQVHICF